MDLSFKSVLAEDIRSFLDMKRSLGYKYDTEEYVLHSFDDYWYNTNGTSTEVTMESLAGWMKQRPTERKSSLYARINTVKLFLIFRNSLGRKSYIPMEKIKCPKRPVIHVLSLEEISALFSEIDAYRPSRPTRETLRISKEYPVIFRLILTTGMRRTEAVSVMICDLDISGRSILIKNAKGHKDRMISISYDMAELLKRYLDYLSAEISEQLVWLFPSVDPSQHLSASALGIKFNDFWNHTVYAQNCSPKPTIHSLRHTFVVMRINAWADACVDTAVMMPYLCRYLGHKSADETFYYYHQVLDSLEILRQKDTVSASVLPEVRIR